MNLSLTVRNKDKETMILKINDVSTKQESEIIKSFFDLANKNEAHNLVEGTNIFLDANAIESVLEQEEVQDKETKSTEPEFWKTGIKYDDEGVPRYKTHYECECGNKGRRYVYKGSLDLECHNCGQPINIEPATRKIDEDGLPGRDSYGNFYTAKN